MTNSRSLFRNSAILSGLVSKEQLEDVAAALLANHPGGSDGSEIRDEQIAGRLVQFGVITPYQAEQLLEGRTRFNLGAYVITDFIGKGGMGDVFKAQHNLMGREVAVKVLPRPRSTPEAEANFQREIRLQAKLDHANLVRAYDAGRDGNVYYLVVEFVPGTDLRRLVRTHGKLDMEQAATVIMQAAIGLDHAHSQGLIHRDVKPGNLLVTPEGHTKVSDLGLAGFMGEGQNDPRAGKIVGTADYIAPEVYVTPANVSPLSDIYSLGCTLYYAVTGKVPYPGGTTREKLERHCNATPYHPQRFNESLTEEFAEVIGDMMEKDPRRRCSSAAEVAERLSVWASGDESSGLSAAVRWLPPALPVVQDGPPETVDYEQRTLTTLARRNAAASGTAIPLAAIPERGPRESSDAPLPTAPLSYVLLTVAVVLPVALAFGAALAYVLLR